MNNLVIISHPDKKSFCYNGIFNTIVKEIKDIMEGARVIKGNTKKKKEDIDKIVDFKIKDDTVENLTETLQKLEDEMFVFAKKMEFEKAAVCRDKINSLKRKLIDL